MALWTVLLALHPVAALLQCRQLPPFIPDVGRKSINSWCGPAHFLAGEVCLNCRGPPGGPPQRLPLWDLLRHPCVYVRERERALEQLSQPWLSWAPGPPLILLPSVSGCQATLTPGTQCLPSPELSVGRVYTSSLSLGESDQRIVIKEAKDPTTSLPISPVRWLNWGEHPTLLVAASQKPEGTERALLIVWVLTV